MAPHLAHQRPISRAPAPTPQHPPNTHPPLSPAPCATPRMHTPAHLDISPLWQQAHPHLQPLPPSQRLPLPEDTTGQPIALLTHLDLLHPTHGLRRAQRVRIWHHPSPDTASHQPPRYTLSPEDWQAACHQTGLPSQHTTPIGLDARLWSASPTFLNLEPTTRCNYSCWYCVGRHMPQGDITPDTFSAVLDHFPHLQALALVGEGEPLMHKGFFDMAAQARDRGIRVLTISNGSTFSSSNVAKLCEAGVTYISISIDSVQAQEFARSRIDGHLQQVLQGIQRLATYRDTHGHQYPRIGLKGTLFTHTQDELPAIARLAAQHGADIFESFQPLNPMRTYVPIYPAQHGPAQLPHVQQVAQAIARDTPQAHQQLQPVADFCAQEGIRLDKNGQPNGLRPNCDEEWVYSLLSGDITPCCQIKTPPSPHWNLAQRPLSNILSSPDYEHLRFNLYNGLFPSYCQNCWKT